MATALGRLFHSESEAFQVQTVLMHSVLCYHGLPTSVLSVASFGSCELNGHVTLSEEQELIGIIWQYLVLLLLLEHAWCLSSADCA